jgi:hypothetical protein
MSIFELELPPSEDVTTRLAWAGDWFADLCEGLMDPRVGWVCYSVVSGWADLGTEHERQQYHSMARQFADHLHYLQGDE